MWLLLHFPSNNKNGLQEADFSRSLLEKKQEELRQMEENLHGREMVSQTLRFLFLFW